MTHTTTQFTQEEILRFKAYLSSLENANNENIADKEEEVDPTSPRGQVKNVLLDIEGDKGAAFTSATVAQKLCEGFDFLRITEEDTFYVYATTSGVWEEIDSRVFIDAYVLSPLRELIESEQVDKAKAEKLFTKRSIEEVIFLLKSKSTLRIKKEKFDSVATKIVVKNGVVDLKNGKLEPFGHELLATKGSSATYEGATKAPTGALQQALSIVGREEQAYLQRFMGAGLIGRQVAQKMIVLYGTGANGKSTLAHAIARVMPSASNISSSFFEEISTKRHRNFTPLTSAFAVCEELPKEKLSSSTIKASVGSGVAVSEQKFKDEVALQLKADILVCSNVLPSIEEMTAGVERRIAIVPCEKTFYARAKSASTPDDSLAARLASEDVQSEILGWLVYGAMQTLEEGLPQETQKMEDAHAAWVQERVATQSPIEAFFVENMQEDYRDNTFVFMGEVVKKAKDFTTSQGLKPQKAKDIEAFFKEKGFEITTRHPKVGDEVSGAGTYSKGAKKVYGVSFAETFALTEEEKRANLTRARDEEMERRREVEGARALREDYWMALG